MAGCTPWGGLPLEVWINNPSGGGGGGTVDQGQPGTAAWKVDGSGVTQPVSGTFWPATQPVSGTFWQATQPISAASLPLPTGAATETTLTALSNKTPVLGQAVMAASQPVVIASNQSSVPVSGAFWQSTQPVSGTFWQATQPVSLAASVAVTGTFWQATQPVSGTVAVSNLPATQAVSGPLTDTQLRATALPVSGAFFQATQPVSVAALPLPTSAATETTLAGLNTKVTACNTGAVTITTLPASAAQDRPSTLCVTGTAAAAAGVTITLPAVASQFHYLSSIRISAYNAAARTGGATPALVTTTNIPGSLAFTFGSAGAVGTIETQQVEISGNPFKSSVANTATTIVCPATTSVIWRVTCIYYAAT